MLRVLLLLVTLGVAACWGSDAYIVEGVVLERLGPKKVLVDHEEVRGLMGPMIMPFQVDDRAMLDPLEPGHRIVARLRLTPKGAVLEKIRITGKGPVPERHQRDGPLPIRPGEAFPAVEIPVTGGETWVVGVGQPKPTLLTFLYTTCPLPEFCPMTVTRLQGLQAEVGTDARLVAVTIDLVGDTMEVLTAFADQAGARPETWRFGRIDDPAFRELVLRAGLPLAYEEGEIVHSTRVLVLDGEGTLVERYDDNHWSQDRVVQQLRTGGPPAPAGNHGTVSPPAPDRAPPQTEP